MTKIVTVNDELRVFINITYSHGSQTVCQGTRGATVNTSNHYRVLQIFEGNAKLLDTSQTQNELLA